MDNKTWLWRKRPAEKTIVATNKFGISVRGIDEEAQKLPMGNEGLVRPVTNLNEKLASVLLDCHAKDDLVTKQEKSAQEPSWEKAEAEVVRLNKELEAANEKLTRSDVALKQRMQQQSSSQEEQEQKIHDAVMQATSEFEKAQKRLEEKLMETSKNLTDLAIENTSLSKALLVKEKLVEEVHKRASQTMAEFNALMARSDSIEKENAFLKYEFHMLEKELEVRNEELEYYRRAADASHRQHLESTKKITRLEAECQRLRVLVRKRLPGPAAMKKMKSEVNMLGRDQTDMGRKLNPTRDLILRDMSMEKSPEVPVENINFLIEQLRGMEEENKILKAIMTKKNAELQSSRTMFSQTASRLSHVESRLVELSAGQKSMELYSRASKELYPIASDIGSDDGVSSSGSWASALISELEHIKDEKLKSPPEYKSMKGMSLMNDFVEMEKLAMVSVQTPSGGGKKEQIHSKDAAPDKPFDWLQDVLNAISKQQRISKQSLSELVEDVKIALGLIHHPNANEADTIGISRRAKDSDIRGYITWNSTSTSQNADSTIVASVKDKRRQCSQSNLSLSICKIIDLIEEINPKPSVSTGTSDKGSKSSSHLETPGDYFVRVFQWRSSELSAVLLRFVDTCNGLLNGKVSLEIFVEELSYSLHWLLSNYVTPKDASSTRDKIKKHFGWNESQCENEIGAGVQVMESHAPSDQDSSFQMEHGQRNLQEENKRLNNELKSMESTKEDMEARLQSASDEIKVLMMRLQESEQCNETLLAELGTLKESKGLIEDQIENQKSINEDLDTQLTIAKAKLNEVLQKLSSLEFELEDKSNCCEELEATCLELQLQLESVAKETLHCGVNEEQKHPENGWEITAASVKLAECQETILNLGKQLKALASPREAALFDKVFTATSATTLVTHDRNLNKHFSLRDQMLAEDNAKAIILRSPAEEPSLKHSDNDNSMRSPNVLVRTPDSCTGSKHKASNTAVGTLAIVPGKKHGGIGLLRRLLMRRKKGSSKKARSLPNG